MLSASRGLAPHEGLDLLLPKLGRTRPLVEPHLGLQAGKSGHPNFQNADNLVLRRVQSAKGTHKLSLKWEGPYRVVRVTRPGAIHLGTGYGIQLQNSWNI